MNTHEPNPSCIEKFGNLGDKVEDIKKDVDEVRKDVEEQAKQISQLTGSNIVLQERITNLVVEVKALTGTMNWVARLIIGGIVVLLVRLVIPGF